MDRTRSSSVESVAASMPARRNDARIAGLARLGGVVEAPAERAIARVDVDLLAGLGVFEDDRADVGQGALARVDEADGDDLVPARQQVERASPSRAR